MATPASLEAMRGLYQDLLAVSESRLTSVDRLVAELEQSIAEFRNLLDKAPMNESSRRALETGKITLNEQEFGINDDFKQVVLQLANTLDLDELEAGRLLLLAQDDGALLGRPMLEGAFILFHERRQSLLECLRLVCMLAQRDDLDRDRPDVDEDAAEPGPGLQIIFQEVVAMIVAPPESGAQATATAKSPAVQAFSHRCLDAMAELRRELRRLAERLQSAAIVGSLLRPDVEQVNGLLELHRTSLVRQHESLAAVLTYLSRARHTSRDDLERLLAAVRDHDRTDQVLVHLLPPLMAGVTRFAAVDGALSQSEAQDLFRQLVEVRTDQAWPLPTLRAAVVLLWLSEYSSWYGDGVETALLDEVEAEAGDGDAALRAQAFADALRQGGLDLLLALSADVMPTEWPDLVRASLRRLFQRESHHVTFELTVAVAEHFHMLVLEQLEAFADAFISNMPASLRRLRLDEDHERVEGLYGGSSFDYDLEKFVVILCYSFEPRPDAGLAFWQDGESNLFGFLQWVSRRLSTPRACAVCELLIALSEGEDNAGSAHRFLLDDSASASSAKLRRTHALNWSQILFEAQYFAQRLRDAPAPRAHPAVAGAAAAALARPGDDMAASEPETLNMLASYLRLMARLVRESGVARAWLWSHPTVRVLDLLFGLAGSGASSFLRTCALDAVQALLTDKTAALAGQVWTSLDQWLAAGFAGPTTASTAAAPTPYTASTALVPSGAANNVAAVAPAAVVAKPAAAARREAEAALETIGAGYDESVAFVRLLRSLMEPGIDQGELHDGLPFPESLGAQYRDAGVEPYVDFALGRVFAVKSAEVADTVPNRLLRLTCVDFIMTCLGSFNEDLIVLANRSNVAVDAAMATSSLAAYVRLHPFARVMEWLFNDGVVAALFDTVRQPVTALSQASSTSPLLRLVVGGLDVIHAALRLQATYLDIVRPLLKAGAAAARRRPAVADATLASFDDAILARLDLVLDLGMYCGLGHADLSLAAVRVLESVVGSRKLSATPSWGAFRIDGNRLVGTLEAGGEHRRIAQAMATQMQFDARELEMGPASGGYAVKTSLLRFLQRGLASLPEGLSVAHLLLGFSAVGQRLELAPDDDGVLAQAAPLFVGLLDLLLAYPDGTEAGFASWLLSLKGLALEVLAPLWQSRASSVDSLVALRQRDLLGSLALAQLVVGRHTAFDGLTPDDDGFLVDAAATGLLSFLRQRSLLFDYAATELRLLGRGQAASVTRRALDILLGTTVPVTGGEPLANPSVLELADFLDLEPAEAVAPPPALRFFAELDLQACLERQPDATTYSMASLRQLLLLRQNEVRRRAGSAAAAADEAAVALEAEQVFAFCEADNRRRRLQRGRLEALRAWVRLLTVMLDDGGDFAGEAKAAFVLQLLHLLVPRLERSCGHEADEAMELARMCRVAVSQLRGGTSAVPLGRAGDAARERLFQLFRVSLRGINSPVAGADLREVFYAIAARHLADVVEAAAAAATGAEQQGTASTTVSWKRHSLQAIRACGERLVKVLCDDAYGGEGSCQIAATLLLDGLVSLEQDEDSSVLVEALSRVNFIGVLVDGIKNMPGDLQAAGAQDVSLLLSCHEAKLALLTRIGQSRAGATQTLQAGLLSAVTESRLFAVDPDLGLDLDHAKAMQFYYRLVVAVLRLINAVVLSRGEQNEQTLEQGRRFVAEHRATVVSLFKRKAKIGGRRSDVDGAAVSLEEVIDNLVLLIGVTNFLEIEEEQSLPRKSVPRMFT